MIQTAPAVRRRHWRGGKMSVERAFLVWLRVYRDLSVAERAVGEGANSQESRLRVLALQSRCARALAELQAASRQASPNRGSQAR